MQTVYLFALGISMFEPSRFLFNPSLTNFKLKKLIIALVLKTIDLHLFVCACG